MSVNTLHLVQTELAWEDPGANREALGSKIDAVSDGIIILPEMFSTGFSMASADLAETMTGETVSWMKEISSESGTTLCGSVIIEDEGQFYNRFIWASPDGSICTYDKRHLFRMADEHQYYSPGTASLVLDTSGLSIMPQICYDLRFPVWSRNNGNRPYDVLLYVANWPAARREQWLTLLRARAIENLCYVVAVNRLGTDGNGVSYSGDSCVIDFKGDYLIELSDQDTIESIDLDLQSLQEYRAGFPAHLDADRFNIES